jgi:hypothetical protein
MARYSGQRLIVLNFHGSRTAPLSIIASVRGKRRKIGALNGPEFGTPSIRVEVGHARKMQRNVRGLPTFNGAAQFNSGPFGPLHFGRRPSAFNEVCNTRTALRNRIEAKY